MASTELMAVRLQSSEPRLWISDHLRLKLGALAWPFRANTRMTILIGADPRMRNA